MDAGTKTLIATISAAFLTAAATLGASYINLLKPSEKQVVESTFYRDQVQNTKELTDQLVNAEERAARLEQRVRQLEAAQSLAGSSASASSSCPNSMKTPRPIQVGSTSGTSEAVFELPGSPCIREISIQLAGTAVAISSVGVRASEWILVDGDKELCRAAGSLRPVAPKGTQLAGQANCQLTIPAGQSKRFTAKLANITNSDPVRVGFLVFAEIK